MERIIKTGGGLTETFSGTAQSEKEAQLSFRVNGAISRLPIKVGDRVRRGQLIATIDATDYNVQHEQAKANLKSAETQIKSAEAQLLNAQSSYQRIEKLYENK